MKPDIPHRIGWAVETLAVQGSDSLLEAGCGRGVAIALIAPKLTSGRILAVDRSATAIAAARARNKTWEASGKVAFLASVLADLAAGKDRYDKIFAINVNLFWVDPRAELAVVRKLLKEEGKLYLFYEPPAAAQRRKIAELVSAKVAGSGLRVEETMMADRHGVSLLCLICRPDDHV